MIPSSSIPTGFTTATSRQRVVIQRIKSANSLNRESDSELDEDIMSIRRELKASEERFNVPSGSKDFYGSVKSGFSEMFHYVNPSLERNLQRMNFAKKTKDIEAPFRRSLVPVPPLKTSIRPEDILHIDKCYEHSANSLALNKLPLPSSPHFNNAIFGRKNIKRRGDERQHLETESTKRSIFNLMPKEEIPILEIDPDSVVHPTTALTFFWGIKPVSGSRPESREGATLLILDRKMYLFGGQSMTKRNDTRIFHPDTGVWAMVSTYYSPKGRIGHSLCPYKNMLFLYGGWSHYSQRLRMRRCFKKVYILTLGEENKWQRYSCSNEIPKSRRDHAMAGLGSSMIIFGGIDAHSQILRGSRVLDMESLRWDRLRVHSAKPPRRSGATLTAVFPYSLFGRWDFSIFSMPQAKLDSSNSYSGFYLFGGLGEAPLNDLWVLKLSEMGFFWQELMPSGTPPIARFAHSATLIGQTLVIYGGRNDSIPATNQSLLNDIVILRLEQMRWEYVIMSGAIPPPRWGHTAVGLGSKLYVFGGLNYACFAPAEMLVVETEQSLVSELSKAEEARQEKMRLKRKLTRLAD